MKKLAALSAALAVAACGSSQPDPAPTPTATVAAPRTLVAADIDLTTLGAKIDGTKGAEPESVIVADGKEIGRIESYVACPKAAKACVPAEMPEGTVYTYVHRVTLADDLEPAKTDGPSTEGSAKQMPSTLFRMTRAANGFNRSVGYSRKQAEDALGESDAISVTIDEDQLIWRVTGGSGWKTGQTITFWWQSTVPPQGPSSAYRLETHGFTASVTAPFPPVEMPVEDEPAT